MSSDRVVRAHQQNAEEMRLIQERHRKRRDQVVERNEKQIRAIEDHHRDKKSRLTTANKAAINHIREGGKDRIEALTKQGEKKVRDTREGYHERVKSEDSRGQSKVNALRDRYTEQQEMYRQRIQRDTRQAKNQQKFIAEQTKAYGKQQELRKEQIYKTSNEQIDQIKEKNAQEVRKAKLAGQNQTKEIEETYRDKGLQQRKEYSREIANERKKAETRLKTISAESQKKEEKVVAEHNQRISNLDNKNKKTIQDKQTEQGIFIKQMEKDHSNAIVEQNNQQRLKETQLKADHEKELQKIHKLGNRKFHEEKVRQDFQMRQLENQHERILANETENFEIRKQNQNTAFRNKLAQNDQIYKANLEDQKGDFIKQLELNHDINQRVLSNREKLFTRELIAQRDSFAEDFGKYDKKEDDPFYRIPNPDVEFVESDAFYTLKAKIPEHERGNVEVKVQRDRITIAGEREFAERINNEENSQRVQTNNYQTFRQEFDLDIPAVENAVAEKYEDGVLTVTVAKVGFRRHI